MTDSEIDDAILAMALPLPDDHHELSAELLVFLLRHPRLAVERVPQTLSAA